MANILACNDYKVLLYLTLISMPQVLAQIQGDLVGARGPRDFLSKKLLIPSVRVFSVSGPHPAKLVSVHLPQYRIPWLV